ncbi:MAG: nucleoside-diphosphate sugar epimerase/dehydratase [Exilibacterium sp.]
MLKPLLEAPRKVKRAVSLTYDTFAIITAIYLSVCLRLGVLWMTVGAPELYTFAITVIVSLIAFIKLGLYRAILRYMAQQAMVSIAVGVCISSIALATSSFFTHSFIPRSVPIIYIFTALFFIGTPRLLIRSAVLLMYRTNNPHTSENAIIYGAGYSGFQLVNAIHGTHYRIVGFIDDNPKLYGTLLQGFPIIKALEFLGVGVKTVPPIQEILTGKSGIADFKDVEIEDLLGRDPVQPIRHLMHACITQKVVMVTGAGGSIGSELCRQIIRQKPKRLVLFELNEYSLYKIQQELKSELGPTQAAIELTPIIGSVQNRDRLEAVMTTFNVQTVYHTAAYKHVPLVEHNIIEGVKNNVFGTWYCAEAAIHAGVESFVLISTDKAVRPTNIMGTSKRVAELILQSLSQRQNATRFTMVRFGNVLGSSGSVVPLFRQQIKQGGPVTVTHPEIIRYFMTIPEAAELVIQAGAMGKGGDVFVLDMGEPVKILDLAKRMIKLSGLDIRDTNHPDGDIEIHFSGLRDGEKLFEELLIGGNISSTEHPRILRAIEKSLTWHQTQTLLKNLDQACRHYECDEVKQLLQRAPTDFSPQGSEDVVWRHRKAANLKLVAVAPAPPARH